MRKTGNKAFTLVELLIVIMIIGILATLTVPTVLRALDLARQAKCNVNVQAIFKGLSQYSSTSEEMPVVPTSNWNTRIGSNLTSDPFAVNAARNHSANLWLLARGEHVSLAAFVCPATEDFIPEHQDVRKYSDFGSSRYVSYGLQSPYGWDGSLSILMPKDGSNVVLIADGSPYVETSDGNNPGKINTKRGVVDWGNEAMDGEQMQLLGNSPNHEMEGQNVAYFDGRVKFQSAANCGKDGDNIYSANGKSGVAARTATAAGGRLGVQYKNNENDTLILP